MTDGDTAPGAKRGVRRFFSEAFFGVLLVAFLAIMFFVFYVQPQSQYERARIYRSMVQVSRLIDDRTDVTAQAVGIWREYASAVAALKKKAEETKSAETVKDLEEKIKSSPLKGTDLDFGCSDPADICVTAEGVKVSSSIKTVAQNARLPYPEATLLIMDSRGNVLAGSDNENRWGQFQSLGPLILAAKQGAADRKDGAESASDSFAQAEKLVKLTKSYGRGELNQFFAGYPARLSHSFGGQSYAIFMAAHQLRHPSHMTASVGESTEGTKTQSDKLIFAYLVPESVIDWSSTSVSRSTMVNLMLALVLLFLCVPFVKLFYQSPFKPVRVVDLAAIMIALMLIVTTATLFVAIVLIRSSVTRDIERELAFISMRVSDQMEKGLGRPGEAQYIIPTRQWGAKKVARLGGLVGVTPINNAGKCLPEEDAAGKSSALLCGGIFAGTRPEVENLDVTDRAYFRSWRDKIHVNSESYVQFVKSKGSEMLSWSTVIDQLDIFNGKYKPQLISIFPVALRAPVLARNFSVAVVLNTDLPAQLRATGSAKLGDVQFHSTQSLSLIENIVEEARGDPQLVAALQMLRASPGAKNLNGSGLLSFNYHGQDNFAVVRPIPNTPWSVVALYEKTEILDVLAVSVVEAFFLSCLWVTIVLALCWGLPRVLRHTLFRQETDREVLIRGRSIWFFPNTLYPKGSDDGLRYSFETRPVELAIQFCILLLQALALLLWPPAWAFGVCAVAATCLLMGNYLMIAQHAGIEYGTAPNEQEDAAQQRKYKASQTWLRLAFVAVIGVVIWILLTSEQPPFSSPGLMLFVAAIVAAFILQATRWYAMLYLGDPQAGVSPADAVESIVATIRRPVTRLLSMYNRDRQRMDAEALARQIKRRAEDTESKRKAYLTRALALLTIIVGVPTVCIVVLTYSINVERYVGASLITVAERAADQERVLRADALNYARTNDGGGARDVGNYANWISAFALDSYNSSNPGWFVSGPKNNTSGIFSVSLVDASANTRKVGWISQRFERLGRDIGIEDTVPGLHENLAVLAGNRRDLVLRFTDQYQTFRPDVAKQWEYREFTNAEGKKHKFIAGGNTNRFPFHPGLMSVLLMGLFAATFAIAFYYLVRGVAGNLTGLYLLPFEIKSDAQERLTWKFGRDFAAAWKNVGSDGQRARLLALANFRTINFRDRSPVRKLVEDGYIALTPYVRISNPEFADYIRHDLDRSERDNTRRYCSNEDDRWEHLRLPLIIAFSVGCLLIAYTSPNAVQLVTTSFFAMAAFLPLVRDPLGQMFTKHE